MVELSKIIRCDKCRYAIYIKDRFTGNMRIFCGNELDILDNYGNETLMCDVQGGCEFGIRQ